MTLNTHHIPTLAEKALLVRLRRRQWNPYVYDKLATSTAEQTLGVQHAGRYTKRLMKGSKPLERVSSAYTAIYRYVQDHTLPWLDDGMRLLKSSLYLEFTQRCRTLITQAEAAVNDLSLVWHSEVQRDMARLGPLADPKDYPDDITKQYAIDLAFFPIPTSGDFRIEIDEEARQSLNKALQEAEETGRRSVIERMIEPLQAAAQRLAEYKGEQGQRWHDTVITNIVEAAQRLEQIALTDDPQIIEALRRTRQMAQSAALQITQVKEDPKTREAVRQQVTSLVDQFQGLV